MEIVEPALVRGVQDSVAGPAGSLAKIAVPTLHLLPHRTQRMDLPPPGLKDKAAVPAFGQVLPQGV